MVAQTEKRLIWHPRGQNKFVVGGSTQITLYEWIPQSSEIKQVASQLELNQMKCFAWSPDPVLDDLLAVGFSNGRVDLLRFEASKHARNSAAVSLPARNTRACNALGFSPANANSLAVGLDKVRNDPSLVIWDIHAALPSLSFKPDTLVNGDGDNSTVLARGDGGAGTSSDPKIVQHYASAEVVSTLAWLPKNPPLLLAGISHRWLQLFDTRTSASPAKAASKVHGIATDPFDAHRVACYSEGIVSIWDIRRFSQPVLTFTSKDASADGADRVVVAQYNARGKTGSATSAPVVPIAHVEFSSTRRGTLATLERDASHVRFWDIHQAQFVEPGVESARSRDSSQSGGRAIRTSWVKPWAGSGSASTRPSSPPAISEPAPYHLVLADTRRTKTFSRPFTSFALVPSANPHPLTSNVMLVNKDGDLELYALHDTPVHPPWSSRGDLALGIGCSYTIIPGITDLTPPSEPWKLVGAHSPRAYSGGSLGAHFHSDESTYSMGLPRPGTPPTFGRGDEDGFPALISATPMSARGRVSPSRRQSRQLVSENKMVEKELPFEHTAVVRGQAPKRSKRGGDSDGDRGRNALLTTPRTITLALDDGDGRTRHGKKPPAVKGLQNVVESDISMLMRNRAAEAYGLTDPRHNSIITRKAAPDNLIVSELWSWILHSQRLILSPSAIIEGYNFSYQGLAGIWEGFRPIHPSPPSGQPTPRIAPRSTLFDASAASPLLTPLNFDAPPRPSSKHAGRKRNQPPATALPEDFLNAIEELNRRTGGSELWKPSVSTTRLSQRRFALQLCGWSLAPEDLARVVRRWEKEGKYSQAACWLVFTEQYKQAIDILMRGKDESLHMMSGMLAALTSNTTSSRNPELAQHCERLIVRLQDPYLRALLTRLAVREWTEVLEEDSLPLRERLAIAFQFLDDKEVSSYLRRIADRAIQEGDIHGLFVTGLTAAGMELLQAYIDSTGDVQTAALVAALSPTLARESRAARWMDAYRGMLDGWRLFHHRCHLDTERGTILKEAVEGGEIQPFDWAPKQMLLRCNYCSKPIEAPFPAEGNPRPTVCPNCGRPLPRCSVCLMTLNLAPESGRGVNASVAIPSETIHEALVFCQTCRHGGHASHILEWFYGEGGAASRAHGTCPIAGCDCRCGDEM